MSRVRLALAALLAALTPACGASASPPVLAAPTVKAGSMARFIAHVHHLYALDGSTLATYRLRDDGTPELVSSQRVDGDPETLFPYGELLFVGTQAGMRVYSLAEPDRPNAIGVAEHLRSCDPVVVENDVAYVTLRSGSRCRGGRDALLIFDVTDPTRPVEIGGQPLPSPHGLGIDGDSLFVADARDGLLVFDVRDPRQPRLVGRAPDIQGYDVIAHGGVLVVSAEDGIYQYAYGPEGVTRTTPLSVIPVGDRGNALQLEPPPSTEPPQPDFAEPPP
ncbi:MAG: hypothetical protein R3B72_05730 [Polyangiaceae bacterium]